MPATLPRLDIAVENVSVTYNNARLALYNATCTVEPGTITALVGPNGSGKSTLFKSKTEDTRLNSSHPSRSRMPSSA